MKKLIFLVIIISLCSGCEDDTGEFTVKVVTPDRQPVEGATVSGCAGMWDFFGAQTDSRGTATLPDFALGERAGIQKTNFYPKVVLLFPYPPSITPFTYVITPTPKKLKLIGNIKGWIIRSDSQSLITIDRRGGYHVYAYNDQSISEIASAQIAGDIRKTEVHGNTLWFNSYNDGIYAYSLEDPLNPQLLFHLEIPGEHITYAIKDNILVVGTLRDRGPVRVYTYIMSGEYQEIAQFGNYQCRELTFLSNYLILITFKDDLHNIYDFQDPSNPYLVNSIYESEFWFKCLYKNALIFHPSYEYVEENAALYKLMDLTDPYTPTTRFFLADSELIAIINDTTAVGRTYRYNVVSVLSGDFVSGFKTVSIVTEDPIEFGGYAPPYFVIAERLWKFEEQ
ncbi:hypothetical protein ES703_92622 [subsurface metagenome]